MTKIKRLAIRTLSCRENGLRITIWGGDGKGKDQHGDPWDLARRRFGSREYWRCNREKGREYM